ncbi:GIN domain-containing protein [Blastomonas aquatica]|uniref:Putative auto-transporter adhesin head GIN domain-containing protein n=1 Tax=Blastomonas aquatica TaxID=1510276 RepID=A0ABQ1IX01_9SPHN|nr:DUF2807 domain-containing protein [Blastomonas aquatica]GGB51704.1 hypothetical protein GCM10010833_03070 [Blastomonas aquatica]
MKAAIYILTAIGALAAGAAAQAAERRFTLSTFDKVRIEGNVAVEITSDAAPFAIASGDPRALEALSVKVQGGTLYIRRARRDIPTERRNRSAGPDALPMVTLGARSVSSLTMLGHGSAKLDRLSGAKTSATMDGNGSVEIGSLNADAVAINVNGSGSLKIGGQAASGRAVMLGDGLIEGGGLELGTLDFTGEGPVRARLTVDGTARIAVKGDADVQIGGDAVCTVRQAGVNVVTCANLPSAG